MSDSAEHVERYIRDTFGLDEVGLRRVAVFLLAHVLLDTRLISRAMFKTISDRSAGTGLPLTAIQAIADEVANGTFGMHLSRVRDGLPGDTGEIAEKINEARNALLHWSRDRFSLPVYKGQDVVTEEGFRACMEDVLRFLQTVPFEVPVGR
ncbi:MAG TPA: hypothetical protein VJX92_05810 [Methylomirabilota bacterium]|nr:hypothetical protein [Methylomirabilota bacterium]